MDYYVTEWFGLEMNRDHSVVFKIALEKEVTTHSRILTWKIPSMEEPGRLLSTGCQRVRYDRVTSLSLHLDIFVDYDSDFLLRDSCPQ